MDTVTLLSLEETMNFEKARFNMVEQQVRPWEVFDQRVLDVLHAVPREDFVPEQYRQQAYADLQIPLAHQQVMLAPVVEARILQAMQIQPEDTVLEIGTGSGYLATCLASLSKRVISVDIFPEFTDAAHKKLSGLSINGNVIDSNVEFVQADVMSGWQPAEAVDAVIISGALPELPDTMRHWLKPAGRLFAVIGNSPSRQAQLITRESESDWLTENLFETDMPELLNTERKQPFEF